MVLNVQIVQPSASAPEGPLRESYIFCMIPFRTNLYLNRVTVGEAVKAKPAPAYRPLWKRAAWKARKFESRMDPSLQSATSILPSSGAANSAPSGSGSISYQVMTVAAILVVLLSMWVF